MGAVLRLVNFIDRETSAVLRALTSNADAGKVRDVLLCYRIDGREYFVITGRYRRSRAEAVKAAARMKFRLLQAEEDEEPDW